MEMKGKRDEETKTERIERNNRRWRKRKGVTKIDRQRERKRCTEIERHCDRDIMKISTNKASCMHITSY